MTYDTRIKLNAQISEEAAEWFIEFRTGDIDAAGRRAFDVWVRSSQEHLRAYLEIAAIWNEGGSLDARRALDVDTLISLAQENVVPLEVRSSAAPDSGLGSLTRKAEESAQRAKPTLTRSRLVAIAASVALLICATTTLLWLQSYRAPTFATDVGEQRSIRLPDGSTVELNSRSRVRVHFTEAERAVDLLEGQALFQVAKNPARPFIVRSDDTRVRAVGTQFDVYKKRGGTIVTVVEGKVAILAADNADAGAVKPSGRESPVSRSGSQFDGNGRGVSPPELHAAILLSAGEQLTVTAKTAPRPARVNVAAATAWTQRQLVLESAPLAEVAEEFNRYSTRKLVVEDSASHELRLSGVFETDPDFLIRYLRERPDITVHETDREIRIIRHD
jgi:transmembrane sensor